ncbi:hypothetical protein [Devosia sp. A369]
MDHQLNYLLGDEGVEIRGQEETRRIGIAGFLKLFALAHVAHRKKIERRDAEMRIDPFGQVMVKCVRGSLLVSQPLSGALPRS